MRVRDRECKKKNVQILLEQKKGDCILSGDFRLGFFFL